jgi:hypothetical protein
MTKIASGNFINLIPDIEKSNSRLRVSDSTAGLPGIRQHLLPQDAIGASLISLARFFQPRDHVSIQPHGDSLFYRPIEPSPHGIFPHA